MKIFHEDIDDAKAQEEGVFVPRSLRTDTPSTAQPATPSANASAQTDAQTEGATQ